MNFLIGIDNVELKNDCGEITSQFTELGILTLHDAIMFVWKLPYGRNAYRERFKLVLSEKMGTCSTKHALLAELCLEQKLPYRLMCGIYEMNEENTKGVGKVLNSYALPYIPEAHCYIFHNDTRIDVTKFNNKVLSFPLVIKKEIPLLPHEIGEKKMSFHQEYIHEWIEKEKIPFSFKQIWTIREECIKALSQ